MFYVIWVSKPLGKVISFFLLPLKCLSRLLLLVSKSKGKLG